MSRFTTTALGALLLVASGALHAQQGGTPPAPQRARAFDCSRSADPQQCEARRQALRERFRAAREACQGRQGDELERCIGRQLCAKSEDPARCEQRVERAAARRS